MTREDKGEPLNFTVVKQQERVSSLITNFAMHTYPCMHNKIDRDSDNAFVCKFYILQILHIHRCIWYSIQLKILLPKQNAAWSFEKIVHSTLDKLPSL